MTANPNREQSHAIEQVEARAKRDYDDGYIRGFYDGYGSKEREEIVLANIEKVSPAFVRGYRSGKWQADYESHRGTYDPDDYPDYNDPVR